MDDTGQTVGFVMLCLCSSHNDIDTTVWMSDSLEVRDSWTEERGELVCKLQSLLYFDIKSFSSMKTKTSSKDLQKDPRMLSKG